MTLTRILILPLAGILCACTGNKSAGSLSASGSFSATPEIKFEIGAGHGYYDYAPSFIRGRNGIIYGFLCENKDSLNVVDHIYLYKGIPEKGKYSWHKAAHIIGPSPEGWDSCHICDPDVREFRTSWKGETYNWIMTYLGVDQWDCNHNQIGLAVSKKIEGPYIKYDGNPIIAYEGKNRWGKGQSTSIVLNDSSIVVYYASSASPTNYARRTIVMNDLDNIRMGEEEAIPHLPPNSYPMYSKDKIFMVSEMRSGSYDSSVIPTWVGDICRIRWMPADGDIFAKENPWSVFSTITPELSGFPRNHNPGFLTDTKGYLPDKTKIVVYFTTAVTGENWLWSYDLYSATFSLKQKDSLATCTYLP